VTCPPRSPRCRPAGIRPVQARRRRRTEAAAQRRPRDQTRRRRRRPVPLAPGFVAWAAVHPPPFEGAMRREEPARDARPNATRPTGKDPGSPDPGPRRSASTVRSSARHRSARHRVRSPMRRCDGRRGRHAPLIPPRDGRCDRHRPTLRGRHSRTRGRWPAHRGARGRPAPRGGSSQHSLPARALEVRTHRVRTAPGPPCRGRSGSEPQRRLEVVDPVGLLPRERGAV